jgi:hypothetical protein
VKVGGDLFKSVGYLRTRGTANNIMAIDCGIESDGREEIIGKFLTELFQLVE